MQASYKMLQHLQTALKGQEAQLQQYSAQNSAGWRLGGRYAVQGYSNNVTDFGTNREPYATSY